MIKFRDQVPLIYTSASRDFQYLSWLINIVLNNVKHNIDDIYKLPTDITDSKLTELLALTLGFKVKRVYEQKQLRALVSILPSIMKNKGTEKAVKLAGEALVCAAQAEGEVSCKMVDGILEIQLPKELIDIALFIDLLPYILPAGIPCHLVRKTTIKDTIVSKFELSELPVLSMEPELAVTPYGGIRGLSTNFRLTENENNDENNGILGNAMYFATHFDSTLQNPTDGLENAGRLNNTFIPILDSVIDSGINIDIPTPATGDISYDEEQNE
jgi:hypothetical protein